MKKATQQQTKEHNSNLVFRTIFDRGRISRAEIARLTGLTRTTVSDQVAELMQSGLVEEVGMGESIGGKTPILLGLVEDSRYLIGLNLAHNCFTGAIVNLRGRVCEMIEMPIRECSGEEALEAVYKILDQLFQHPYRPLIGIGVGTPGQINTREGLVINAVNLNWVNLPLARLLEERYNLPVGVVNDSQAAALGEFFHGEDHPVDENLIVINVGRGIGAGIILNGRLFQGDGGAAGEIGHINMLGEGGQLCRCGNRGCLETVASARAVIQRARLLAALAPGSPLAGDLEAIDLESLQRAFEAGDRVAQDAVLEAARSLGVAVGGLVGALNIQKIIMVGPMTIFGQPWVDAIRASMRNNTLPTMAKETRVQIGHVENNGILLGASALLMQNYSFLFNQ